MEWLTLAFGFGIGVILAFFTTLYFFLRSDLLSSLVISSAGELIDELPQLIEEKPELVQKLVKPFIKAALNELGVSKEPNAMKDLKIGGIRVPAWLAGPLVQKFLGSAAQKGEEALSSILPP